MKKFSASLLAISFFVLILCGCDKMTEPIIVDTDFTSTAEIVTDYNTMEVEITAHTGDDVSITLVSPDSLKGLCYHKVNSTLYIEYKGLKCTTTDDYLASYNPFEITFDIVSSLSTAVFKKIGDENDSVILNGSCDKGEYLMYVCKDNGKILKIVPMFEKCEIIFS